MVAMLEGAQHLNSDAVATTAQAERRTLQPGALGLRFDMRTLMVFVAICAIISAYAFYYQPLTSEINYRFATIDASAIAPFLPSAQLTSPESDQYKWIILNDEQLSAALQHNGAPARIAYEKSRSISSWPLVAETGSYHTRRDLSLPGNNHHLEWEFGSLTGFLGSRLAGLQPQLRIDCKFNYSRPVQPIAESMVSVHRQKVSGNLFYEGRRPEGHLIFITPIDAYTYQVIVFCTK